jgi:hypothetical protein
MFQQQYTGVIQRDKTEARYRFPCNCALEEYDCCRRTKPVRPWPSDFGVESCFRDRKHLVFALGTILRWCVTRST